MSVDVPLVPLRDWPAERNDAPHETQAWRTWPHTRDDLARELVHLRATDAEMEIDADSGDILRSGANLAKGRRARTGRVRLTVYRPGDLEPLTFCAANIVPRGYLRSTGTRWPCAPWELSARAILLTLEALRAVDRHGVVERGEQWAGFAPLGITTGARALPPAPAEGTPQWALMRLAERAGVHTGLEPGEVAKRSRKVAVRDGWLDEWDRLAAIVQGREATG